MLGAPAQNVRTATPGSRSPGVMPRSAGSLSRVRTTPPWFELPAASIEAVCGTWARLKLSSPSPPRTGRGNLVQRPFASCSRYGADRFSTKGGAHPPSWPSGTALGRWYPGLAG